MNRNIIMFALVLIIIVFTITACAPGAGTHSEQKKAGFFFGIWHGWIAPISLIWHLFNPVVRIYEVNNVGWLYDLGFYLAIVGGFGGISLTRRRR